MKHLIFILSSFVFTGCTTNLLTQKNVKLIDSEYHKAGLSQVYSLPADLKMMHGRINQDGLLIACTQPATDIARSDMYKSHNGVMIPKKLPTGTGSNDAQIDRESATTVEQLDGRSSPVLLARDNLYHTCIAIAYGWVNEENREKFIENSLNRAWDVALNISITERLKADPSSTFNKAALDRARQLLEQN